MENENQVKAFNKSLSVKFSDEAMYDEVKSFLDSTDESNATLLAKAIERVKRDNQLADDTAALPESLQSVFFGGVNKLDLMIESIRNEFSTLAHSSALELDFRTAKLEKAYVKQVESLQKNVETLTNSEIELKSKVEDLAKLNDSVNKDLATTTKELSSKDSMIEKLTKDLENAESVHQATLSDKDALIAKLQQSESDALRQSASKDDKISKLEDDLHVVNQSKHEVDSELSKLKLELELLKQSTANKDKEIERLHKANEDLNNAKERELERLIKSNEDVIANKNKEIERELERLIKSNEDAIANKNKEIERVLELKDKEIERLTKMLDSKKSEDTETTDQPATKFEMLNEKGESVWSGSKTALIKKVNQMQTKVKVDSKTDIRLIEDAIHPYSLVAKK